MATIEERPLIVIDEKTGQQRAEIRYRVRVRRRGAPTVSGTFARKTDAKDFAKKAEAAILEGRYSLGVAAARKRTLAELIDRYIEHVLPTKPKAVNLQTVQLNWWKANLGAYSLADITPALITHAKDALGAEESTRGKRSPATLNRYLAALSHVFTVARRDWGWADDNPVKLVRRPKEPRGRTRFLSDEERRSLLEVSSSCNHDLYQIIVLALSTGMRRNEILSLKWTDIDFKRGQLVVQESKNGERRAVALVGVAAEELKARSQVRTLRTQLVFPGRNGKPLRIQRAWESVLEDAKIENCRFHDLRHSAASYLAMNGATLAEIGEILGHKTMQMVRRYAHFCDSHTKAVVERMNLKILPTQAPPNDNITSTNGA